MFPTNLGVLSPVEAELGDHAIHLLCDGGCGGLGCDEAGMVEQSIPDLHSRQFARRQGIAENKATINSRLQIQEMCITRVSWVAQARRKQSAVHLV